jgi:hypothetical protein
LPDNAGGAVCSQNRSPWVPPCGVLIWGTSFSKGITLHIIEVEGSNYM